MKQDLNPSVAAAVELLVAHGWQWVGSGLQPRDSKKTFLEMGSLTMQNLHKLRQEEVHLP